MIVCSAEHVPELWGKAGSEQNRDIWGGGSEMGQALGWWGSTSDQRHSAVHIAGLNSGGASLPTAALVFGSDSVPEPLNWHVLASAPARSIHARSASKKSNADLAVAQSWR